MEFRKQVNRDHYDFESYYHTERWCSIWHQINEVKQLNPSSVLEVGGGLGVFKASIACFGVKVKTVDVAEDLRPDIVGSVTDLPIDDNAFDVTCAFQVLEHLPYENFRRSVSEMLRVSRKGVVISLPFYQPGYNNLITIPKIGKKQIFIPRPLIREKPLPNGGEHFWEINRQGYPLKRIRNDLNQLECSIKHEIRVPENPYHYFFALIKTGMA